MYLITFTFPTKKRIVLTYIYFQESVKILYTPRRWRSLKSQTKPNMVHHCNAFLSYILQYIELFTDMLKRKRYFGRKNSVKRISTLKIICKLYPKVNLFVNNLSLEIHYLFRKRRHSSKVSRRLHQQKWNWKANQFQWAGNLAVHTSISTQYMTPLD